MILSPRLLPVLFLGLSFSQVSLSQTYCKLSSTTLTQLKNSLGGQVFQGYGCNATGGLGGRVCVVKKGTDNPTAPVIDSLRYCVEKRFGTDPDAPVIITFDPNLLGGKFIRLAAPLYLRSNTTIDGRMPANVLPVTISNQRVVVENLCSPHLGDKQVKTGICDPVGGNPGLLKLINGEVPRYVWQTNVGSKGLLLQVNDRDQLNAVKNVIITDLKFRADMPDMLPAGPSDLIGISSYPNPCAVSNNAWKSSTAEANSREVTGCPVMIEIGHSDPLTLAKSTDIVIANNDFSFCGNKCVIANAASDGVTYVRNHFHESFYSTLLLMSQNYNISRAAKPGYIVAPESRHTFYQNHFEKVLRRSPRCASYIKCHAYGNVIENWGSSAQAGFGLSVEGGGSIVAEWNFFTDPTQDSTLYSARNMAVAIHNSPGTNLDGSMRDPSALFLGRIGLVKDGAVLSIDGIEAAGKPDVAKDEKIFVGPGLLSPTKPFDPALEYKYTAGVVSTATYQSIILGAGPRNLAP